MSRPELDSIERPATFAWIAVSPVVAQPWTPGTGGIYYNGGNVGIGTSTPSAMLTMDGAQGGWNMPRFLVQGTGDMRVRISSSATTGVIGGFDFFRNSGAYMGGMYVTADTADLRFYTPSSGNPRVSIQDATGRVGIGTASPLYLLSVNAPFRSNAGEDLSFVIKVVKALEEK